MRKSYDFTDSKKNPYPKKLKKTITIKIDDDALEYFKKLAAKTEVPYQTLINMYQKDCANHQRKVQLNWK